MKILHFYHQQNDLQARYVGLLMETMATSAEVRACTSLADIKQALDTQHYDILHIHGCWSVQYAKAVSYARQLGTRITISPHGELEPWILKNRQWQEKMPKTLLYQRQTIQDAYAVIVMGTMERQSLEKLGWNPRIETIRNTLITHSITPAEMTSQLMRVYRKVMDSDVYHLMNDNTRHALLLLLKAASSQHPQWLHGEEFPQLSRDEWRQLFIYGRHEQLDRVIIQGVRVLGIKEPLIDVSDVQSYFPESYQSVKTIAESIGNKFVNENKRLLATFKFLHRMQTAQQMSMAHLIELTREIREHDIDEEQLAEILEEEKLLVFVQRLMAVLGSFGLLEEGMMPVEELDDKQAERISQNITNRLKI